MEQIPTMAPVFVMFHWNLLFCILSVAAELSSVHKDNIAHKAENTFDMLPYRKRVFPFPGVGEFKSQSGWIQILALMSSLRHDHLFVPHTG
jgi:hypothetical protein